MPAEQPKEDLELAFYRLRRTLKHLWAIKRGQKEFNPSGCDGCREIQGFLTDPNYQGDPDYPVGVSIDRNVMVDPEEME